MTLPVAYTLEEVATKLSPRPSVVTLGVFDGVHRGHASIIEEVISRKERDGLERAYLITFNPHPVLVTRSRETPPILTTIDERIELFSRFPLDGVLVVEFNKQTALIDYRDFIDRYLLGALDMRHLVLGYDHHFGFKRQGSPERVSEEGRERGFGVTVLPAIEAAEAVVSSTNIRNALLRGDVAFANRLLGHPYTVRGLVVEGEGRGKGLGFPTANLEVDHPRKLWPPTGVYAVRVDAGPAAGGRLLAGMMNVGTAPTVKGGSVEIEVHIFDFNEDLYGTSLLVHCEAFLREERRFESVEGLVAQLGLDRKAAKAALGA